jgi:hypothetical protein
VCEIFGPGSHPGGGVFPGDGLAGRLKRGTIFPVFKEAEILKKLPCCSLNQGGVGVPSPGLPSGAEKRGTWARGSGCRDAVGGYYPGANGSPNGSPKQKLGLAFSANPLISLVGRRGLEPQT